jgi:hypothetical protein
MSAAVQAQSSGARGLDFTSFLHLERGMTEGQVLSIAGQPDLLADQGFTERSSAQAAGWERNALVVRTYTYLPTSADPYTTTITLVGGQVTDIRRDQSF